MPLVHPEQFLLHDLELLELQARAALVVRERVPIFWKSVLMRGIAIPRSSRSSSVSRRFCAFASCSRRILGPHPHPVDKLRLPRLDVPIQVEMSWSSSWLIPERKCVMPASGLLREAQVGLRDEHGPIEHPEPADLLGV